LNQADGILFGVPTYMGTVSAEFKRFMESSSSIWSKQAWKDKLASGFVNSGSLSGDKLQAMTTLVVFAGQHSMIWVTQGLMPGNGGASDAATMNRLGSWLGVMSQSDNDSPEKTPPAGDRATAVAFGQRFAEAVKRWSRGAS
jgi:NAD(P)H dehydrogenase (quinone)